jgi:hypothetical protein
LAETLAYLNRDDSGKQERALAQEIEPSVFPQSEGALMHFYIGTWLAPDGTQSKVAIPRRPCATEER